MPPHHPSTRTLLCLLALLCAFSGGEVWAQDTLPRTRVQSWTDAAAQFAPPSIHSRFHLNVVQTGSVPGDPLLDLSASTRLAPAISVRKRESKARRYVLGALIGGGIGALAGLGAYELLGCEVEEPITGGFYVSDCSPTKAQSIGGGAILGGFIGLLVASLES